MTKRWQLYAPTLFAIWAYTFAILVIHLITGGSLATIIIVVAVTWSIINLLLVLLLQTEEIP